jgi:hypothetical protein
MAAAWSLSLPAHRVGEDVTAYAHVCPSPLLTPSQVSWIRLRIHLDLSRYSLRVAQHPDVRCGCRTQNGIVVPSQSETQCESCCRLEALQEELLGAEQNMGVSESSRVHHTLSNSPCLLPTLPPSWQQMYVIQERWWKNAITQDDHSVRAVEFDAHRCSLRIPPLHCPAVAMHETLNSVDSEIRSPMCLMQWLVERGVLTELGEAPSWSDVHQCCRVPNIRLRVLAKIRTRIHEYFSEVLVLVVFGSRARFCRQTSQKNVDLTPSDCLSVVCCF